MLSLTTETACQVEVAGAMSLANWRRESLWTGISQGDLGSPNSTARG
ncbi:hypothetical protein [Gloeothece verrucosa]|nr:hypothetical protein [Gloeothece verrucosa]